MKKRIKKLLKKNPLIVFLYTKYVNYKKKQVVYNVNHTNYKKNCLLIYITHPFVDKNLWYGHQNAWQSIELARIIGERGYNVDVSNFDVKNVSLKKNYDMVIGLIPRGIDYYSNHLTSECIKIAYLTSSNISFSNAAEIERIEDLEKRRGVRLIPRRQAGLIDKSVEKFDGCFFIGNKYNFYTYNTLKMPPVFYIKNNGYEFDFSVNITEETKKNFLFFGSAGAIHKGLDLLLEIFAQPDYPYHLYICGGYEMEKDFYEEYDDELNNHKNIFPMGFVDVSSEKFKKIVTKCAYTILPSASEGQAGSLLTVMSAGVIPIASKICGYDEDEVILLDDCKKETIDSAIHEYAEKPLDWIKTQSEYEKEIVRTRFSEQSYIDSVEKAMDGVLAMKKND